jgi:hypothetical protein
VRLLRRGFYGTEARHNFNVLLVLFFLLLFDVINARFDIPDFGQHRAAVLAVSFIVFLLVPHKCEIGKNEVQDNACVSKGLARNAPPTEKPDISTISGFFFYAGINCTPKDRHERFSKTQEFGHAGF